MLDSSGCLAKTGPMESSGQPPVPANLDWWDYWGTNGLDGLLGDQQARRVQRARRVQWIRRMRRVVWMDSSGCLGDKQIGRVAR